MAGKFKWIFPKNMLSSSLVNITFLCTLLSYLSYVSYMSYILQITWNDLQLHKITWAILKIIPFFAIYKDETFETSKK